MNLIKLVAFCQVDVGVDTVCMDCLNISFHTDYILYTENIFFRSELDNLKVDT